MSGILLCFAIYTSLAAAGMYYRRRAVRPWMRKSGTIICLFNTLALVLFLLSLNARSVTSLKRGDNGTGQTIHELEMQVEGVTDSEKMEVRISERAFTPEQEEAYLKACRRQLRKAVLGGQKASHITGDIRLPKRLPDNPTVIDWRQDRYDVMNSEGEIEPAALDKEGSRLVLTAQLTCGSAREEETIRVTIYPKELRDRRSYIETAGALVTRADQKDLTADRVELPSAVGGKRIRWKKETGKSGYLALLAGLICAAVIYEEKREKKKREEKRRAQMIETDYPRIVMMFSLLLRAGLTSRRALAMIVQDYEKRKKHAGERPAYEALAAGIHQMEAGVSQEEVYLELGSACDSARFERFGHMLTQNLRSGSSGMADQLAKEARESFEDRKAAARKKGEEAQIKLLFPMLMLLGIVLMAVMVPAFLSMQV